MLIPPVGTKRGVITGIHKWYTLLVYTRGRHLWYTQSRSWKHEIWYETPNDVICTITIQLPKNTRVLF